MTCQSENCHNLAVVTITKGEAAFEVCRDCAGEWKALWGWTVL